MGDYSKAANLTYTTKSQHVSIGQGINDKVTYVSSYHLAYLVIERMSERRQREEEKKRKIYNDLKEGMEQVSAVSNLSAQFVPGVRRV